jgi:hypothetical protein
MQAIRVKVCKISNEIQYKCEKLVIEQGKMDQKQPC